MYIRLLQDARFFAFLLQCDRDLAEWVRRRGCDRCRGRGRLHRSDYERKPRGGLMDLEPDFAVRYSFCCAEDDCRRRVTPPSLRFLGRKVYLAAVVLLASAMQQGPTPTRVRRLRELFGISPRTLARWRVWWRTLFVATPFWKGASGTFGLLLAAADLPRALLDRFPGTPLIRLLSCLRLLLPITGGSSDRSDCSMVLADPQKMHAERDTGSQ